MTRSFSGLATRVYCIILRGASGAERLPKDLERVLPETVEAVNRIKSSRQNERTFCNHKQGNGAEHD